MLVALADQSEMGELARALIRAYDGGERNPELWRPSLSRAIGRTRKFFSWNPLSKYPFRFWEISLGATSIGYRYFPRLIPGAG
jgi:hypothetical protein